MMNMMNTMRRGLATTAMSLICLMAGTMNTLAATDAGTGACLPNRCGSR
ncbi:MAG: hypothetical protein ACLR8P_23075 [Clostridium fessum]